MRSFISFALATLVASTAVLASPTPVQRADCEGAEYCASNFSRRDFVPRTLTAPATSLTNAERLAQGLPLLSPHRRDRDLSRRDPLPSPGPQVVKRGVIQVTRANDGAVLGFISKNSFSGAQYRYQSPQSDALIVSFSVGATATSASSVRITSENSDTGYQILSLVEGRDNINSEIKSGSYQYLYIAASNGTPPGSTPQAVPNSYTSVTGLARDVESDVWNINLVNGAITPQWINPDSSTPNTLLFTQSTALYAGGDSAAFNARYPSPVVAYTLTFIPI